MLSKSNIKFEDFENLLKLIKKETVGDVSCSFNKKEFERLKKQLDDIEKTKKRKEKYAKKYHN